MTSPPPSFFTMLTIRAVFVLLPFLLLTRAPVHAQQMKQMEMPKHKVRTNTYPSLAPYPVFSTRKIALLHMYNRAPFFHILGSLTLANKARYAARHGYELVYRVPEGTLGVFDHASCDGTEKVGVVPGHTANSAALNKMLRVPSGVDTGSAKKCLYRDDKFELDRRAPTFGKIKLTMATCRTRPGYWVLWTDADAMVVNQTLPLEYIIDDRYDMILSVDWLMINAGMILFKCSGWTKEFLSRVYAAREFDMARALDQEALQHFIDAERDMDTHLKIIPKYWINVYTEEYRPGDFLLHMAGKLYEAQTIGATAIAHQYDMLSTIEDVQDIHAFFNSPYLFGMYSGTCDLSTNTTGDCPQDDTRRKKLPESLLAMSHPNRYRHVGLRYYWIPDWKDKYDTDDWLDGRVVFDPSGVLTAKTKTQTETKSYVEGGEFDGVSNEEMDIMSLDQFTMSNCKTCANRAGSRAARMASGHDEL